MYSEDDLNAAVAGGAITAADAARLREFTAARRATPSADEEQFRLLTSFNDIFVSGAVLMTLVSVLWFLHGASPTLAFVAVAALAWGLAEFFTRLRRMALPSIVLLFAFTLAVGALGAKLGAGLVPPEAAAPLAKARGPAIPSLAAMLAQAMLGTAPLLSTMGAVALAALAHWWRFRVPITVAALTLALLGTAVGLLLLAYPALASFALTLTFACGAAVFAQALWWDASDPRRTTRRADVAFWLHLAAAPLLVHPIFSPILLTGGSPSTASALVAVLFYALLAAVALVIDRRALMVSSQVYAIYALSILLGTRSSLPSTILLTGLVLGPALLLLSAFWQRGRAALLRFLPLSLRRRLPPA